MAGLSRRGLLIGGGVLAVAGGAWWLLREPPAPIGFDVDEDVLARARALLTAHPVVDAHAHPGRTFVRDAENVSGAIWWYVRRGTFEARTLNDMRAAGVDLAAFAAVADFQTLGLSSKSGLSAVREFAPGEAWDSYKRQIGHLDALVERFAVQRIGGPEELAAARAAGRVGMLLTIEGGDFLEGRAERVSEAHADGVRSITLVHYRHNELGDIMTQAPRHGGLTAAGREVVREMNRCGMIVDVAHASEATAFGILETSDKPVINSHTHVHGSAHAAEGPLSARFISLDLARAIAEQGGGVLGAWPAGIGISDLSGFVDRTFELIERVGIDHVCLGTDMDANYKPVLDSYAKLPHYVAGLLQRGLSEADLVKLIGGNFLRVFAANRT